MFFHGVLVVAILLFLIILIRRIKEWNEWRRKINQFGGPKLTPLIGDLEFMTKRKDGLISMVHERANIYTRKGYRVWFFFIPCIVISDARNIEKVISSVLHNEKGLSYKPLQPWLGTGLLTSGGEKWHKRRKLLTPSFHFNILQEYLKIFNLESRRLVESLKQNSNAKIDIKPVISQFTLNSICETVSGISLSSIENGFQYRNSIENFVNIYIRRLQKIWFIVDFVFYFSINYWIQKSVIRKLHEFSNNVITERKKYIHEMSKCTAPSYSRKKKMAMLDLLLINQMENGNIDDEGIREEMDTFTFEGHDTTAVSLTHTLMLLANHRECQDKIYEELLEIFGDSDREITNSDLQNMKYMEMCIKESLRLYPSVPFIGRIAGSDIEIDDGLIIPKGCNIMIPVLELHRDPNIFQEPENFNPDRFLLENCRERHPFAYLPFSGGPRNCIGQKFAMMELKCCLAEILRNFVLEPVDTPDDLTFPIDIVLRSNEPVRVKFVERTHRVK